MLFFGNLIISFLIESNIVANKNQKTVIKNPHVCDNHFNVSNIYRFIFFEFFKQLQYSHPCRHICYEIFILFSCTRVYTVHPVQLKRTDLS